MKDIFSKMMFNILKIYITMDEWEKLYEMPLTEKKKLLQTPKHGTYY